MAGNPAGALLGCGWISKLLYANEDFMNDDEQREARRILKSGGFTRCNESDAWFSHEHRKHFSEESFSDMSLKWLRARFEEKVPDGEFWIYSYRNLDSARYQHLVSKYELHSRNLLPVGIPFTSQV